MWIAALCSDNVLPNLEAALKGVFNRELKNLRKASASSWSSQEGEEKLLAIRIPFASIQTSMLMHQVFHALRTHDELNDDTPGDALLAAAQPGFPIDL